ncbi:MAG: bifunctional oligoribonuclease/PAP phosphatase NrnA [Holophagales bacterium]|nr:bifunctional oligoribonuclease/PAP phosphatase NrnA [Holophagales bacterium]MYG30578.1 bifunctional oligoribonuclease/PAP phosphatase NrnA [Holophagales bacterium]MYI79099.1 bifunctional oligoribonuclease/PAP phosphatase NrnA [Holophagales bacterium]
MNSPGDTGGTVPRDLLELFRSGGRFLLSSHAHPDGDAIGSEVALARLLRKAGRTATIWNADPAPDTYAGVTADLPIHVGRKPPAGFPDEFDFVVPLECPRLDRTGLEDALSLLPILNIDHHLGNELYGRANWVDTEAPAVAEMVLRLARALDLEIDEPTATALYLGLSTDTGSFRFSNATPRAFEAAADLVRYGARPERVATWVYESQSPGAVRLLAEMLGTLELHCDERIASVRLELSMFERAGARQTDSEGLIDHPRAIRDVEAVVLFRERPEGDVKVSLRSRGRIDVGAIAARRGGGGHRNAAGCLVRDREDEQTLIAELATAVEATR